MKLSRLRAAIAASTALVTASALALSPAVALAPAAPNSAVFVILPGGTAISATVAMQMPGGVPIPIGTLNPTTGVFKPLGDASAETVTPTGVSTGFASILSTFAAQQGVLLDVYDKTAGTDYTAALLKACSDGVPILLASKTYPFHDFSCSNSKFVLKGIPGQSILQRLSAGAGSQSFKIDSPIVYIDGVTFDFNKANVTANQWGLYMAAGGQTIYLGHDVFKNNSGTLGTGVSIVSAGPAALGSYTIEDSEIASNSFNAVYLTSVSQGRVVHNYIHDNAAFGLYASSNGTASVTNYLTDLLIAENNFERNGGNGASIGGYAPPYNFGTPPATHVQVVHNDFVDNAGYGALLEGDFLSAVGNHCWQSASSVTVYGCFDHNGRYGQIIDNVVNLPASNWGIDIGGSIGTSVMGNDVTMTQGTAYNVGGNLNSVVSQNKARVSGTATAFFALATESGGGAAFPTLMSGTAIDDNDVDIVGSSAFGVRVTDNAGGFPGAYPTSVKRDRFHGSGTGNNPSQDIVWYGAPASVIIDANLHNGGNIQFNDPIANGDATFENVYYGGTLSGNSSTNTVRAIIPSLIETYGGGGSILWAMPSAGGSGYTSATTLSASGSGGGSGWTGTPLIIGGAIVGVRTTTFGSGYSGTITITATDSGGGSGATFTVGNNPGMPKGATLTYYANVAHLLQRNGGTVTLNAPTPIELNANSSVLLQAGFSGAVQSWNVNSYTPGTFASTGLPTCNAAASGALATVTGSASGKWQARCNGANWIYSDGTTAP